MLSCAKRRAKPTQQGGRHSKTIHVSPLATRSTSLYFAPEPHGWTCAEQWKIAGPALHPRPSSWRARKSPPLEAVAHILTTHPAAERLQTTMPPVREVEKKASLTPPTLRLGGAAPTSGSEEEGGPRVSSCFLLFLYFRKALKKIFTKCPENLRRFIFAQNEGVQRRAGGEAHSHQVTTRRGLPPTRA